MILGTLEALQNTVENRVQMFEQIPGRTRQIFEKISLSWLRIKYFQKQIDSLFYDQISQKEIADENLAFANFILFCASEKGLLECNAVFTFQFEDSMVKNQYF